jgi:hypothetical protein
MDERARALAREAEQGDPRARVALLAHRLRAGLCSVEQLRLAAWLGDGVARTTLGESLAPEPTEPRPWIAALGAFGQVSLVRGGIAVSERFLHEWPAARPDDRPSRMVPGRYQRHFVVDDEEDDEDGASDTLQPVFPRAALGAALAAAAAWSAATPQYAVMILANVLDYADPALEAEARAAIRETLIPWCLGSPPG